LQKSYCFILHVTTFETEMKKVLAAQQLLQLPYC